MEKRLKLAAVFVMLAAPAFAGPPKAAILLSDENKVYNLIETGVREVLGKDVPEYNLQNGEEAVTNALKKDPPQAVVAIGNTAVQWAREASLNVPIVAGGVIRQSKPEIFSKMPGVSLDCPASSYFKLIRDLGRKKVGMIFEKGHSADFLEELKDDAGKIGLKLNLEVVAKEKEVSGAVEETRRSGAQVFLMSYDPLIMNPETFKYLLDYCVPKNILLIAPSRALVKGGAFAAIEADYQQIGRRTGQIANNILNDPSLGGKLTLEFPQEEQLSLNLKLVRSLHMEIPSPLLRRAVYTQD